MEVDFFGIGDAAIEELLKGYEPSWFLFRRGGICRTSGCSTFLYGRLGRYPPAYMLPKEAQAQIEAGSDPRAPRRAGHAQPAG